MANDPEEFDEDDDESSELDEENPEDHPDATFVVRLPHGLDILDCRCLKLQIEHDHGWDELLLLRDPADDGWYVTPVEDEEELEDEED